MQLKGAFSTLKAAANLLRFNENTTSIEAIKVNQKERDELLTTYVVQKGMKKKDILAVKQFWATQTWFLINFLLRNIDIFNEKFNFNIDPSQISKSELLGYIDQLIKILEDEDNFSESTSLINLVNTPSHSSLDDDTRDITEADETPTLFILSEDSIALVKKQIAKGKKVLIMDAANAQRPGAGAYEKGTFQEALTRTTDLYWNILADFRDVLEELPTERKKYLKDYENNFQRLDVFSYQCRYLKLILHFIKQSIQDPDYIESRTFLKDFLEYADRIYSEMQNNVFEIPIDSGFTKNCQIIKTNEITDTSDLFDDNDLIKSNFSEQYLGRLFIVEVAAPDRRDKNSKLGSLFDASKVDRGCSYDSARRAIKDEIAETIIANAIEYTLQQAIKNNVDVILLNAFGCGAFNNDPTQVASIFSESLSKYRRELSGKTIYFVDLCPIKCMQFGQIFSDRLNNQFNINPYRIGNTSINLLANRFEYRLSDEALVQSTTKEHLSHKNIIPINLSSSVHIGKEILILEQHYYNAILQALERRYSTIRFPLLGTGNNKFYMGDSIYAFVAAVQKISAAYDLSHIRICLHIDDTHKYSQAIRTLKLIQNDFTKEASLKKEIQKFFTISSPTTTKIINFAGGRWQAGKHTQWDKIIEHLWLGVIPTRGNVMTLQEMIPSLKLVVSVVEDFELASEGTRPYVLMQTPLEWEELGIAHQHLVVDDMKKADDFPSYELIKTIVKMHYYIQQGHDVLVHCKAGRSRSATIVLLYLMIFTDENNETIQDVSAINLNNIFDSLMEKHSYLKECRPRASLHEHHYDAICKALELIKRNPKLLTPKPAYYEIKAEQLADLSIADQIHAYLATKGAHSEIMQLSWFKQLKIISIQNPDQREEIQAFLNSVKAKDGKWLSDLFSNRAPDPIIHFRNQVCELLKIQLNSSEIVAYLQESSFTFKK